jgi:hypothetical protein
MSPLARALAASTLLACTSSTEVVRAWHDPSFVRGSLHKPLVVAVSNKPIVRDKIEDALVAALREAHFDAVASHTMMSDRELTPDALKAKLPTTDRDSVLVTHLVDVKLETVYVPEQRASYAAMPLDYPRAADHWVDYYAHSYQVVTSPGYTYETKKFILETNLYDVKSDSRVWSIVTTSEEPSSLDSAVSDFASAIVKELR